MDAAYVFGVMFFYVFTEMRDVLNVINRTYITCNCSKKPILKKRLQLEYRLATRDNICQNGAIVGLNVEKRISCFFVILEKA